VAVSTKDVALLDFSQEVSQTLAAPEGSTYVKRLCGGVSMMELQTTEFRLSTNNA
jgi:hypothetical protein